MGAAPQKDPHLGPSSGRGDGLPEGGRRFPPCQHEVWCGVPAGDVHTALSTPDAVIEARLFDSNFKLADSNFYSLSSASDGNVYYTLCSHNIDTSGRLYRYDPKADKVTLISSSILFSPSSAAF